MHKHYFYGFFCLAIGFALIHGIGAFWLTIAIGFLLAVFWQVLTDGDT